VIWGRWMGCAGECVMQKGSATLFVFWLYWDPFFELSLAASRVFRWLCRHLDSNLTN
jgi:hypothetical protein